MLRSAQGEAAVLRPAGVAVPAVPIKYIDMEGITMTTRRTVSGAAKQPGRSRRRLWAAAGRVSTAVR